MRLFIVILENGHKPHEGKWFEVDDEGNMKKNILEQLELEADTNNE